MKTTGFLVLAVLMYSMLCGYAPEYQGDITGTVTRNGQLMKNNGKLVNESDSVKQLQTTFNLNTEALNYTIFFENTVRILEIELTFNSAGKKLFIVGIANDTIYQYSL
jgi:hypothetical protein